MRLRIRRPPNRYDEQRRAAEEATDQLISDSRLLGYHCTRLTGDEVASIRNNGLLPLTPDLVNERINRRVAAGDITESLGAELRHHSMADDPDRHGAVCFVLVEELLRDEHGVGPLLRSWGGEAVYRSEAPSKAALTTLGTPCIVEAWLPVKLLGPYTRVSKVIIARYLEKRGVATAHITEIEGRVTVPIPVHRIVLHGTADFEHLTACNRWHEQLT